MRKNSDRFFFQAIYHLRRNQTVPMYFQITSMFKEVDRIFYIRRYVFENEFSFQLCNCKRMLDPIFDRLSAIPI